MTHFDKNIISDVIRFDGLNIYMIDPNIVVSEYYGEVELNMELAQKAVEAIGKLTGGKAFPNILIACPGLTATKEVRDWGATAFATRYNSKSAIVCNLLSHRILGNFLIKVQKPKVPTRMFNKVEDAIIWLLDE